MWFSVDDDDKVMMMATMIMMMRYHVTGRPLRTNGDKTVH